MLQVSGGSDVHWRVGVLAPRAFHFYTHEIVSGMGSTQLEIGQQVIPVDLLYRREEDIPDLLAKNNLDGLILGLDTGVYTRYKPYLGNLPMVNVHPDELAPEIPTIAIDPRDLAQATIDYFKSLGITNLATIRSGSTEAHSRVHLHMEDILGKTAGYFDSFTINPHLFPANYQDNHEPPIDENLDEWLTSLDRPTGVLTSGGYTAFMVIDSAKRMGISIPDALSVLSRSDDNICLFANPPISSFRSVGALIGQLALTLLIRYFNGQPLPGKALHLPAPSVSERFSTGVPAGINQSMVDAVHYIRRNAFKGITVDDVLNACPGLSRSSLYRGYTEKFGNSPAQEITRLRINEAKHFLQYSEKSLHEISNLCSFKNPAHFSKVFSSYVGTPPGKWLKKVRLD